MTDSSWTNIATFGTRLEADIAKATLEQAGVLVLLRGEQTGMFGPGFPGWAPGGATVAVPNAEVTRAMELLEVAPD